MVATTEFSAPEGGESPRKQPPPPAKRNSKKPPLKPRNSNTITAAQTEFGAIGRIGGEDQTGLGEENREPQLNRTQPRGVSSPPPSGTTNIEQQQKETVSSPQPTENVNDEQQQQNLPSTPPISTGTIEPPPQLLPQHPFLGANALEALNQGQLFHF